VATFRTRAEQLARQEVRQKATSQPEKTRRTVTVRGPADAVARKPVDDWRDRQEQRRREHEEFEENRVTERAYWKMIKDAFHRHHPGWKPDPHKKQARLEPIWQYRYGKFTPHGRGTPRPEDQWAEPDEVLLNKVLEIYKDEIRAEWDREETERIQREAAMEAARKAGVAAARAKAEEALTAKVKAVELARAKATEAAMAKLKTVDAM
jgi:hypothetical protein